MRVLVIAPHMDDEVLGVGGTIARHVAEGDDVYVCFVAHRIYNRVFDPEKNSIEKSATEEARKVLGYKEAIFFDLNDERLDSCIQDILIPLEKYITRVNPHSVYICHRGDNHQDHRAVFQAAMVALRPSANRMIEKIMSYEVPSSTEQSPPFPDYAFLPTQYVNIEKYLPIKLKAMRCYEKEQREFPHPRSEEGLIIAAKKRGVESGFSAAEAFIILRERRE